MTTTPWAATRDPAWLDPAEARVEDLRAHVERGTDPAAHPRATTIEQGVPLYRAADLTAEAATPEGRRAVQAELVHTLLDGPGIAVFTGAFAAAELGPATSAFDAMIAEQRASGAVAGDHFAKPGANDRIWNAVEKLALRAPEVFTAYYANPLTALVCEAWLGPGYQVTSQVNVVNPGGAAQNPHRDYHLGFMDAAGAARYPAHVHRLSPALTLQGAVAHCDMPVESGPTMYLPGSQTYPHGYLVAGRPEFREYFADAHVQLPLAAGDAVFFNPALIHGAGHNRSAGVRRMANLLQVSSAFGRAMESADRAAMARAVFPALRRMHTGGAPDELVAHAVSAAAEGYAFPTDLDADPPVDGLAPPSPAAVLLRAVREGWDADRLDDVLAGQTARRRGVPA
ncbi:phytanoyl-CoA dioxygenase [Pseudonocardia sp. EC080610-09]|uniref:phytanoyl-CoA dioxygenase family protein n=1 Tax=unclassified Pseudonocardia TaxID=2619320 RepID=UPI0006CAF9DA|nr:MULTISPECIES: phytanoyl-CoA dioxygenase family protein [unclassified Pseudonocardia]ALE73706.1 phytanoyl-CoA dioxygenase [Pseudonocardia sp. EC080625-04]ALL76762.1 phytanoyl-CoA dioxygenase [Pseudonocardia sp. EC080610-09]ALL83790.1 phytanoyl-CoA dioxygenase [Pseudonocardia sp. EC080619-01]